LAFESFFRLRKLVRMRNISRFASDRRRLPTVLAAALTIVAGVAIVPVLATSQVGPFLVTDNTDSFAIAGVGGKSNQNAIIGIGQGTTQQVGVVGTVSGTQSYGVEGISSSSSGAASFGVVATSITGNGVYSYTTSPIAAGIYAANLTPSPGSSSSGNGITAVTSTASGSGVEGDSYTASNGVGVLGQSLASGGVLGNGFGVVGVTANGIGLNAFDVSGGTGMVVDSSTGLGAFVGTSSTTNPALMAQNSQPTSSTSVVPIIVATNNANKTLLDFDTSGNLTITGTVTTHGTPAVITRAADGRSYGAYGSVGSEPKIDDEGQAELEGGSSYVALDPRFASTLEMSRGYLVFVTAEGDTRGLYVNDKSPRGFAVHENAAGRSTVAFDYRIVGHPLQARGMARMPDMTAARSELRSFNLPRPRLPALHRRPLLAPPPILRARNFSRIRQ